MRHLLRFIVGLGAIAAVVSFFYCFGVYILLVLVLVVPLLVLGRVAYLFGELLCG